MSDYTWNASEAVYIPSPVPHYSGNPLIEVLPSVYEHRELYNMLSFPINYERGQRFWDAGIRKDCITALFHIFQPWKVHVNIAEKFGRAIRNGYVNRNPMCPEFVKELNQLANCVHKKDGTFQNFYSTNPGTPGFTILGASGMGKTATINRILMQLYPQKILHTKYNAQDFHHLQLVWMKLTCPHDGSVKGLCTNFFKEFDILTGDRTYQKFAGPRATVDTMLAQMSLLARRHSLGALVIDEIQNINFAKSGGKDRMLNFLADLMDTLGIPIIVIGTPNAIQALSGSFMTARRNTGEQGVVEMKTLAYGSGEWEIFIEQLWKYQWTNVETELTEEISQLMNKVSKGVVSVAVSLYAWVQDTAISDGRYGKEEKITIELICEVADSDEFRLLNEQLSAIDAGDMKCVKDYAGQVQRNNEHNLIWSTEKTNNSQKSCSPSYDAISENSAFDASIPKWDTDPKRGAETMNEEGCLLTPDDPF